MTTKAELTAQLLQCGFAVGDRLEGGSVAHGTAYYGTVTGVRLNDAPRGWIVTVQWDGWALSNEYRAAYVARRYRRVEVPR